jgi:predicted DNA-binding transcriptional regulator AlpA
MTLDTVKSFSSFTGIGVTKIYELTRAKDFPIIRTSKRGKILIKREEAIRWLERKGRTL